MNRNPYPAISAVYVLRDWKGNALYAGSTANIRRRLQSHQHRGKFANVEIIPCAKELLRQEEQKLIDELRPILNINPVATRKGERAPQHRSGLKLPPKTSEEKRAQVRAALTKLG